MKTELLTIEKLRSYSGCEHFTDEEAVEIIISVETFTHILYEGAIQKLGIERSGKNANDNGKTRQ